MKKFLSNIPISMFSLVILIFAGGCNKSINLQGTRLVPAAEATVKVDQDNNNNYEIEIDVKNLANPQKLTPSQNVYMAWYQNMEGTRKLGQIKVGNNLKGSLETVVTSRPQRIFVTAEPDPSINYPGSQVVLETSDL